MDPYLALLELRCTPVDSLESPAKLLMSRNLRSALPATDKHLKPKVVKPSKALRQRSICQERQKKYYDRSARSLKSLSSGQKAHLQMPAGQWQPVVNERRPEDHSYIVETKDGGVYTRNRKYLMHHPSKLQNDGPDEVKSNQPNGDSVPQSPPKRHPMFTKSHPYVTRSGRVVKKSQHDLALIAIEITTKLLEQ